MKVTIEQVRTYLREMGWKTSLYDDNDIVMNFKEDDDCPYPITIFVNLKGEHSRLQIVAIPTDCTVPASKRAQVMLKINKENFNYNYVTATLSEDGGILVYRRECLDEEVSEAYIRENCLKLPINGAFQYIAELVKEF